MGETEGETTAADARPSEDRESVPPQDTLQVPTQKRRKLKSPTPLRGRSATPIRGRSQTPFSLYMIRRSATPSTWRSITPFLKREEKEKTPFELGRNILTQITCNKAVFDRALIMDISEPEELQKPVRYITSDMSVIDRAAVMDVSNVEVIYVVEEYEEYEEEEEIEEVVKPKKKTKGKKGEGKKGRGGRKSADKEQSPGGGGEGESGEGGGDNYGRERSEDREESADFDEFDEPTKKGKKKGGAKRKEKSPSPKLTLKLEMGGGQKASKKMYEDKDKQAQEQKATARPPPKKSKLVLQMEEQAKAAAKAAEDAAAKQSSKPKSETYEERQKRIKAEKEEQERLEAEQRALEEALRAQQEAERAEYEDEEEEGGEEGESEAEGEEASSRYEDESRYDSSRYEDEEAEEADEVGELPSEARRGSDESEGFTRPDPYEEERWQQIAEEEGEEFMQQLRKYSLAIRKSEKQRDEEWKKRREQLRIPHFIVFLSDRTVETGHKVRLTCAVGGPELSVKWFKDGRQLERDATHRIINNNNILILEVINTTILDSGEYSCVIANMNDEVTSSCFVTIYEVFKDEPAPPTFKLIKEYYHLRDDELTIEMHIHGVPRPVVTWWKSSFEIKPNFKFTMLEEAHGVYKLLIYKPNNRDSGTYICKAINSCGEAQMRHTIEVAKNLNYHVHGIFHARGRLQQDKEQSAKKAMEEAMKSKEASDKKRVVSEVGPRVPRGSPEPLVSPKQKLKFATQLRDRMALEGSTVRFVCNVIGPNPASRWMKDDNFVKYGENVKNFSEEGKPMLELRNVTTESSGVYKCVAKNDHSEIETSCYFKVYAAQTEGDESEPIFALPLRDVYHSSQNDLVLDTKVRGNPRPSITWLKDRVPVVLDDRIVQIEHLDGICELIINKPTPSDNGTYFCVAQNKLGSQEAQHSVVVDVVQTSRRSSTQSAAMSDSSDSKSKGEQSSKAPKGKKKEDEGGEAAGYERRSRLPEVNPKQQLYFNAIVSNRYVTEGSKVKLQAVVMGPNPAMKWMKDDQNLTYGPRIRNMSRDCLAVLEFLKAMPEDSGTYTLVAQNEYCKISTSAKLLVYSTNVSAESEPVFTRPLRDTYHLNTNELILETGVRGQPAPKVQWFKDSVEVEKSERLHISNHTDGSCELVIDYPSTKDSGKYTVKAESSAGKAEITHLVTFAGKDHHIADNIHGVFHADKNLLKAKLAELEVPKDQKHPEVSESEGEEGKGKGKGKAKARGKKDEEEEVAAVAADTSTTETPKKREKVIGIHFPTTVKDRVVAEGSKVKISCFLAAKEPQVKWFKNEEPIQNSPKIRGRHVEGLCTLEITSATEEDSGEYKCWARDETGEASTFCRLKVYADPGSADVPPTFTRNIKETYHPKLHELQLECHVRGSPTAIITWVKDGVKIEQSDKYQHIDHNDGTCELVVTDPAQADSGKYVCQAENRAGKAEIAYKVTVEPKRIRAPSPPMKESKVSRKSIAEETTDDEEKEKKKAKKKKDDEEEGGGRRREVPPPPDMKKRVYLRNFLSNRTVKEGSNVKWVVNIDGAEPTARWFHGETPIVFGPKSKMNLQDGIAWLQLVKVTEEDSGEYLVKVKGPENEVVSTCNLFVYSTGKEEIVAPVFTVGIKDVFDSVQHLLIIESKVTGKPKPKVYWQRDSTLLIEDSNKYKYVELDDGVQQLVIINPTDSDTGLYTCYAESESGQMKISKFIDLSDYRLKEKTLRNTKIEKLQEPTTEKIQANIDDIQEMKAQAKDAQFKLRLETPMKSMTIAAGCKAQLICYISGFIEDVYWLRDDERIFKDARHKIYNINNSLSLEIYEARTDDSGKYKCVVRNSRNTIESQCQLDVYDSISGILPAGFSQPITVNYDGQRGELLLACHVHGRPKITWLRDDHNISNNRYRIIEEAGGITKLIIRNPIHTDCGSFSCYAETNEWIESITKDIRITELKSLMSSSNEIVENGLITDFKQTGHAKEMITAASNKSLLNRIVSSKRKPMFNTLLHDRNVTEGSNLRLSCNLLCDDNTKVDWLKDMKPLLWEDKRFQTSFTDKGEVILEIFTTEEADSGQYVCRASNDYGETSTQAYIRIYKPYADALQPSVFVQSIRDTYSLNDNELVLDCRVRGKPRPDVQWMKGTDYIVPGEKYTQVNEDDGYTKIIVHNPTEKDSGLYACVARNEAGENKLTHHVEFVGRERFSFEKTHGFFHRDPNKPHLVCPLGDQTVHKGGTIAISAEFMQTQSPIDVQWLLNRQSIAGHANIKTFHDHGVYTLAITDATPECEGTYTCRAQNAFGRIESHAHVDISQGATKEERPPLFLSRPENEMKIAVGDPFSISFRIAGDPKPKLSFLKGTKDITKSDRVSKEASDDYTRFTVQKSQISDSGTYFVVARNNNGTDRLFVTIEVRPRARSETPTLPRWGQPLESFPDVSYFKDPPAAISTEPLLVDSGPTHISLSWGKPPSNNSAPVIAYRVDAWVVGHDGGAIWKELGLTPINSFDAFNLKPNIQYHFRVTPKNRYGWGPTVQTTSPLQVGGIECLPEFTKILPGQVKALLHGLFTLECVVHGSPRPEVIWYKDGLRLGLHADVDRVKTRKLGSTCCLIIKKVHETDAGRYTCEATNTKGRVSTFARLQVVTDPKLYEADHRLKEIVHNNNNIGSAGDTLPIFTMRLRDRRVQVTYPVRLTCQVMGYPKPEISWFKDDRPLLSTKHYLITADYQFYTLELPSTSLNDSGIYTCTAKNELGSVSCHCSLVVDKGIRAYISPEFCMHLDPVYIFQEDQEIHLTAKVEAYPAVGVAWHRNGVKLRPSRRLRVSLDCSGFVELSITDATPCDSGIYSCLASNAVGKAESLCRVCIEPKETDDKIKKSQINSQSNLPVIRTSDMPYSKEPLFVVKPRSSEAYEGDTVIICCEVVGDPKPEVVWLRDFLNPEYYKDAPHFRRIGEGPEYRLEIPYAKLDFTGTYSIIATNCHGETKAIISLQIYAKDILKQNSMEKGSIRHGNVETLPRFIRQLRPLRCCDGDAVTLEAHVEGLPEPIIIWEKDGRVIPSGKDFDITYDGIKAMLSIPRVYPEDEGEYTCVAKNTIGRSLSSACIIVDVPEEKDNMLQSQLSRPSGLLSATSTPLSTPRSTPNRSFSPQRRFSHRHSSNDITGGRSDGQVLAAPKFLAIPNNRVVEEGESVRFQCAIAGHPQPWSTWDKDGMIVTPTARIAVKELDDLRFLEIEEVGYDDAGLYRITLENDYGRIEATARLDVITRSRYSRSPSSRSVRASSSRRNAYLHRRLMGPSTAIGGRMALAAGFRGFSVPSCKFYHNGRELIENEKTHIIFNNQEAQLIIDNVNEDMEGIYTCFIEGQQHEPIVTSAVVHFIQKTSSRIQIPEIVKPLPEMVKCTEGDTIDLSFEINCENPYTYLWTRHGEVITESKDFNYIDHGNGVICLRIYDAFDIDSGIYTCDVITSEGYKCSTCSALYIENVNASSTSNDLMILKSPLPVLARIDDNVTFFARVYPTNAAATWFVSGHRIEEDESDEFTLETSEADGVRMLHINSVNLNHSGEVQLSVNQPGKATTTSSSFSSPSSSSSSSTSAASTSTLKVYTSLAVLPRSSNFFDNRSSTESNLLTSTPTTTTTATTSSREIIRQPAYVLEGPNDCTALIGGCVRLSVIFEGVPKPQVTWFKASRPIVETSNIIINTSARKSVLQISDIAADDSGKYIVQVMNDYGNDVAVASVAVEGPPEPPSGKPSISQGPDRIAIAWCGPPFDGGCMITGFIIEMQELNDVSKESGRNWLEIASVVDSLAYTVKNLKPGCTYRFRVRAENVHGRSEPSLASEPVQIFEKREERNEELQNPIYIKSGGEFKERFEIIEELGKGRFGIVYKVQEKEEPKRILAAKVIKCIKSRDRIKIQEEISIMKSLKHPKLLQLAASFESNREISMVMEYITGGELFERVVADDFTLTERDCILFVRQVCEGVAYMHSQSIVHLDLKPENIMCKTRTCHQIKIIDFGLAQRLNASTPLRVLFGTPEFIPPEIISYEPIGFQSDMWSVGVICYVLLSGLSPFMGDSDVETFANITRADYDFDDEAFDCVSQQAKDFISNLLLHRKEERWSAEQCLESPWLKPGHYDENLATTKICTDKLKKFIIRRKWQKTGNAIRALGRLATLSASRRNSAASNPGSLPCSPRPSISGISLFNPNISVQMSSLHEEEDNFSIELPPHEVLKRPVTSGTGFKIYKARDKSQCSERSDSGYSECSNCSAAGSIQCHCSFKEYESKDFVDHPPKDNNLLTHDLLKKKLEEIAHQSEIQKDQYPETVKELDKSRTFIKSTTENIVKDAQNIVKHDFVKRELSPTGTNTMTATMPIMQSDFTNTVKMRKKSLENSAYREKPKLSKANLYDTPGKVSMLKNKFSDLIRQEQVSTNATPTLNPNKHNKDCMDFLKLKRQDYIDACHDKTSSSTSTLNSSGQPQTQQSISLPNTPLSTRKVRSNNQSSCYTAQHSPIATGNPSTFRLSERVREVTDRLAQQQTICTEARRSSITTTPTHYQQHQQQRRDQKNSPPPTNRKKFVAT